MLAQREARINGDNPVDQGGREEDWGRERKKGMPLLTDCSSPAQKLKQDICHLFALFSYLKNIILRTNSSFLLKDTNDETNFSKAKVLYAICSVF